MVGGWTYDIDIDRGCFEINDTLKSESVEEKLKILLTVVFV